MVEYGLYTQAPHRHRELHQRSSPIVPPPLTPVLEPRGFMIWSTETGEMETPLLETNMAQNYLLPVPAQSQQTAKCLWQSTHIWRPCLAPARAHSQYIPDRDSPEPSPTRTHTYTHRHTGRQSLASLNFSFALLHVAPVQAKTPTAGLKIPG